MDYGSDEHFFSITEEEGFFTDPEEEPGSTHQFREETHSSFRSDLEPQLSFESIPETISSQSYSFSSCYADDEEALQVSRVSPVQETPKTPECLPACAEEPRERLLEVSPKSAIRERRDGR